MARLPKIFALVMAAALVLGACAVPQTATEPATTPAIGESPVPASPAAPSKLSVLRVGWSAEPDTMNPFTTYSTEAGEIIQLVYDKLLGYGLDMKVQPELAASFEYSTDGLALTLKLRENAVWQDGKPFTSEDVKYTYDLIHSSDIKYSKLLAHLVSVDTPDATTVILRFDKPQAENPAARIPILPKHIWSSLTADQIETFTNDNPVGTGPYRFASWERGATLTLERNESFWGEKPAADRIIYVLYGNEDVMTQALKGGDVDVLTEVPPTMWDGLAGAENVKAVSLPSFSFHYIGFNVYENPRSKANPLVLDRVIRQALNYAVDRKQLVAIALAGHGIPGDTIVPAGLVNWHLTIPADQQMNGNPEKAKQLLTGAGYIDRDGDSIRETADGKPLRFRLIAISTTTVDVRAAQLLVAAAEAVGIKLDLSTMDENTLGGIVYNADPDWDLETWGWDTYPDPNMILGAPTCGEIGGNSDLMYCNPEYDKLWEEQATTIDYTARKAIVDEMQQIVYDEGIYIILWYQDKLQAYRTDTWKGWAEVPGGLVYNNTRENYLKVTPGQ